MSSKCTRNDVSRRTRGGTESSVVGLLTLLYAAPFRRSSADSARSGENAPAAEGCERAAPCTNTAAAGTAAEGDEAETSSGEGGAAADVATACAFHGVSGAERD
ncbi:hypothetical protein FGB62_172g01 [Gracilaria domingensis]|nr:hypothetical protein FGB62_172g01 [Gracilaria domingensis]